MRSRVPQTAFLAVGSLVLPAAARADVDTNGPWGVQTTFASGIGTFVQAGTTLSATLPPDGSAWDGSIDPVSGAFSLTGPPVSPSCAPSVITATVDGAGTSFTGTLAVEILSFLLMRCDLSATLSEILARVIGICRVLLSPNFGLGTL